MSRTRAALAFLLTIPLLAGPAWSDEIRERFAERLEVDGAVLELRSSALLRYRFVFQVYYGALYLAEGVPTTRLLDDVPRRLEIEYLYGFEAKDFQKSTREGIARNVAPDVFERLRPRIAQFSRLYRAVEPGDRYALTYVPGSGTSLELNGERLGAVEGADFSRALFSIWFGQQPFDEGFKEDILSAG